MGQYYKPINIDKKQFVYSHDYGNGLKLMEHSYIGNEFVAIVENLIKKNVAKDGTVLTGDWYGDRIVWAGDYADSEPLNGLTKDKNGKDLPNLYQIIGNYDNNKIKPKNKQFNKKFKYLVNLDKKEFVNYDKVPVFDTTEYEGKKIIWQINPLPLLTCEGNGRGGGDFQYNDNCGNFDLIGKWSRNRIVLLDKQPEDCTEIIFDLIEKQY